MSKLLTWLALIDMIALIALSSIGSQDFVVEVWLLPPKLGFSYPTGKRGAFIVQANEP